MKIHPSITIERIEDTVSRQMTTLDNPGFCIECGEDIGCEPDTRRYQCENCGKRGVYGAEELMLMVVQ